MKDLQLWTNLKARFRRICRVLQPEEQSDIELHLGDVSEFPHTRNYAYTVDQRPIRVVVSPELLTASPDRQEAVLRHEVGHAIQFWRDLPTTEQGADNIAEQAWGQRIYYDADGVQTLDASGTWPRPLHFTLRRREGLAQSPRGRLR